MSSELKAIRIASAVCYSVAIASTLLRLYLRRRKLWADDGWAFFSMITLIIGMVAVQLATHPKHVGVARYYLMSTTFYCVIWSARLSILMSVIRIDPLTEQRRFLKVIACLFVIVWVTLMAQLFWVCEPMSSKWKNEPTPQCKLDSQVAIFQLVSDILADLVLLISPLRLFYTILDKRLRRRLSIIFSTCIITTIVSLVHGVYIITTPGYRVLIVAYVEDSISLIVCNIPILTSFLLHRKEVSAIDTASQSHETSAHEHGRIMSSALPFGHSTNDTSSRGPQILPAPVPQSQTWRDCTTINH
ncbi:hypothetical protein BDQ12DRAFT_657234 [Crucibulum laeve]|uniref:Rhodopsin domain-containing protein n=1 Tax=Crucibulum laeve TaxID=68775 RepID=A0A5C3LNW7_9AGAR|nr:hypothetical protein BDQ12DRAFT_657234 [Crucibulum laeve]